MSGIASEIKNGFDALAGGVHDAGKKRIEDLVKKQGYVGYRNKEAKNRTLGLFLCQYLCNGCNLYDLALLRYDDYFEVSERKAFRFFRHKTAEHSVLHAKKGLYSAFPCNFLNVDKHWCWSAGINCLVATFLYLLGSQGCWQHSLNSCASVVRSDYGIALYVFQTVSSALKAGVKVVACGRQR